MQSAVPGGRGILGACCVAVRESVDGHSRSEKTAAVASDPQKTPVLRLSCKQNAEGFSVCSAQETRSSPPWTDGAPGNLGGRGSRRATRPGFLMVRLSRSFALPKGLVQGPSRRWKPTGIAVPPASPGVPAGCVFSRVIQPVLAGASMSSVRVEQGRAIRSCRFSEPPRVPASSAISSLPTAS